MKIAFRSFIETSIARLRGYQLEKDEKVPCSEKNLE
jgi:hypothetical protein